ncbi:hypothetical protein ABI59_10785 [Acidobacteria bacterium Mor1]|nr:hypothetical protein ABI59_10785 [Acidobacteria bacterium Mor1]
MADRIARWSVTAGGLAIIASILGILLFIAVEVTPLFQGASVESLGEQSLPDRGVGTGAVVADEYRSRVAMLDPAASLTVLDVASGEVISTQDLKDSIPPRSSDPSDEEVGAAEPAAADATNADPSEGGAVDGALLTKLRNVAGRQMLAGATGDGRVLALPIGWKTVFVGDVREVLLEDPEPELFELDPSAQPLTAFDVGFDEDNATVAAILADGSLAVVRRSVEENFMSGELTVSFERHEAAGRSGVSQLALDNDQRNLYAGAEDGSLTWWQLNAGVPQEPQVIEGGAPVTALTLLIGGRSLVVGRADGSIEIWFPVREQGAEFNLTRTRSFEPRNAAIRAFTPSMRNKAFLAIDEDETLGLHYSTSERTLWTGNSPLAGAEQLFFAPKGDGAFLLTGNRLAQVGIDNPHPEISFKALFGKVWYEGYEEPRYAWQSSGGTDDFEPKLSLIPLMIGTLKGTVYSLFLAIPLGVLGAMFTAQFMSPGIRRYVKPTVEIMAALPSVVLGFLAGLWLAPRVEKVLPALLLMGFGLPVAIFLAGLLWRALPRGFRARFQAGSELVLYLAVTALTVWLCLSLNDFAEAAFFGGNYQDWLLNTTGLRYDQRNALVVGLAMGFAVIPIIFSISEDAISNVPNNLVSGSLALGANRWQTVARVVLPTASPGIFSAIMIGFGRAIGETMIVLMATGNTPILGWSAFDGFRTLSANIAVEIPEAPQGGTLYRTLFLAALMLFAFTFLLNTVAELVRQRLRKRYAQL